jgi:hypothetical protein
VTHAARAPGRARPDYRGPADHPGGARISNKNIRVPRIRLDGYHAGTLKMPLRVTREQADIGPKIEDRPDLAKGMPQEAVVFAVNENFPKNRIIGGARTKENWHIPTTRMEPHNA